VPTPKNSQQDWIKTLAKVGTLGTDMVIFAGVGFWLGQMADERWGWFPWATLGGTLLGFVVSFWSISRRISDWW